MCFTTKSFARADWMTICRDNSTPELRTTNVQLAVTTTTSARFAICKSRRAFSERLGQVISGRTTRMINIKSARFGASRLAGERKLAQQLLTLQREHGVKVVHVLKRMT